MEDLVKNKLESLYLSGEREIIIPNPTAHPKETNTAPATIISEAATLASTPKDPQNELDLLGQHIGDCQRCRLAQGRTRLVFGVGNPQAELMFIGEAPGRDEDRKGEPFVGRAGQLLTKIIQAMKLAREDVYIANVVKCRPPENRNPADDEIATCEPFLLRQIEIIQPKVIVCLGTFAAQTLLQTDTRIGALRSSFRTWPSAIVKAQFTTTLPEDSIQVMATYHPAFLLRNSKMKRPVWEDMQKVMSLLEKRP